MTQPFADGPDAIIPLSMINTEHPVFGLSGRVADTWAMFEFHVDRNIWEMATVGDAPGACITAQMTSVHSRLRALRALVELAGASKNLLSDLESIAGRSNPIGEERNRIVHDPWMLNVTKQTVGKMRITAKRSLHFGYVPVPNSEVEALLDKIKAHTQRFFDFEEKLRTEIAMLHGKSAPKPPEVSP